MGLIVPYRDRENHLKEFEPYIINYMNSNNIDFSFYMVEQNQGKPFNKGVIYNVAFNEASKDESLDYFVFHDIDMLPVNIDYSYQPNPSHLACSVSQFDFKLPYEGYFGGVVMFTRDDYIKINGYSNEYWGWGGEDDDILHRCKMAGLTVNRKCDGYLNSLFHSRNISHEEYNKNIQKIRETWSGSDKWKTDGLNSCSSYKIISTEKLNTRTHIKVEV